MTDEKPNAVHDYLRSIGSKGGAARSKVQIEAYRLNFGKRWAKPTKRLKSDGNCPETHCGADRQPIMKPSGGIA